MVVLVGAVCAGVGIITGAEMSRIFSVLDDRQKEELFDILGILHIKWHEGLCCCHKEQDKSAEQAVPETEKESEDNNA